MKNTIRFVFVFAVVLFLCILNGCGEDQNIAGGNDPVIEETLLFSMPEYSIRNSVLNSWVYRDTGWSTTLSIKQVKITFQLQSVLTYPDTMYMNVNAFSTGIEETLITDQSLNVPFYYQYGDGVTEIEVKHGSFILGLKNHSGSATVKISDVKVVKVK